MGTYYAMIEGDIRRIRVPKSEIKHNRWEGYVVGITPTDLLKNCAKVLNQTINKGE